MVVMQDIVQREGRVRVRAEAVRWLGCKRAGGSTSQLHGRKAVRGSLGAPGHLLLLTLGFDHRRLDVQREHAHAQLVVGVLELGVAGEQLVDSVHQHPGPCGPHYAAHPGSACVCEDGRQQILRPILRCLHPSRCPWIRCRRLRRRDTRLFHLRRRDLGLRVCRDEGHLL